MGIISTPPPAVKTASDAAYDLRVQFKHLADQVESTLGTIRVILSEFGKAATIANFSTEERAELADLYGKAQALVEAAKGINIPGLPN